MIFGDRVSAADTTAPAEWIRGACRGDWWTAGALIPNQYPSVLRVSAPDPSIEDWWSAYRKLFGIVASIAEIRTALLQVPRFELPNRTYYLMAGPVSAATHLLEPGPTTDWQNPDLFWPDDRRWFVATDVDFWSLYIGGEHDFVTEVARSVSTRCELVALDHNLEVED